MFRILFLFLLTFSFFSLSGQSIEVMPGTDRVFADVQFLKPWKKNDYRFTIFSRSRATVDYQNSSSLLLATYANYTSKTGLGASLIGNLSSTNGAGSAIGINYLKVKNDFSIFILTAVDLKKNPGYFFFTSSRYRPELNEKWKLYTSLELYTLVNRSGHLFSVQRARIGLDRNRFQGGIGVNLGQRGTSFLGSDNYGIFIRKEF